MLARGLAFLVWAAVAAVALYWGVKLFVTSPPAPAHTTLAMATPAAGTDLSRLLGVEAPPVVDAAPAPVVDTRYQLVGVVAPRNTGASRDGVALIAVDGKPAKAYRVGALVEGNNILQSVQMRSAQLGPRGGPVGVALQLPPPALASTGAPPQPGAAALPPPQPPPMQQPFAVPPLTRPGPRGFVVPGVPGVVGAQPDVPSPSLPMGRPVLQ